ncbi:MAG: ABC-F family ATP-binding cassette domain-containing protein, partial [Planctomycetes bacterium]|nr:ABC-F family ATP-binding cassette domain-containing protein [Planctomycetota bacterium]
MAQISLSHVTMDFGGPTLFKDITLDINPNTRIGIIGQNGTGKSTLLRLISGELQTVDGAVFKQKGVSVSYQAQEHRYHEGTTVMQEMR